VRSESLLQGVHRPGIRLSVEEVVQRNKSKKEIRKESRQKVSRKGDLEFLVEASECKIRSQEEKNDSRLLDLVKLHRR
jgi:hypothetical protein